jgi:tight adherence protein B
VRPHLGLIFASAVIFLALMLAGEARAAARFERWGRLLGGPRPTRPEGSSGARLPGGSALAGGAGVEPPRRPVVDLDLFRNLPLPRIASIAVLGCAGWAVGSTLAPPLGGFAGAFGLAMVPRTVERRKRHRRIAALEQQLAELAESAGQALRSGLSVVQALEFALGESEDPLRELLRDALARHALGTPLEQALRDFGSAVGTDDARLFILVVGVHARSGGDLAGALDEVARTIRHRIGVRRELRALSAQGRVSGAILGSLPVVFFLVMSITSRSELDPVLRSHAGMAMVGSGLLMQGIAYLWIRRLLRVEA